MIARVRFRTFAVGEPSRRDASTIIPGDVVIAVQYASPVAPGNFYGELRVQPSKSYTCEEVDAPNDLICVSSGVLGGWFYARGFKRALRHGEFETIGADGFTGASSR